MCAKKYIAYMIWMLYMIYTIHEVYTIYVYIRQHIMEQLLHGDTSQYVICMYIEHIHTVCAI